MSLPCRASLLILALLAGGCDQQRQDPRGAPLPESAPLVSAVLDSSKPDPRDQDYEGNAPHVSNGQLYFHWMNCTGCHSEGGGGIGPSLMDTKWRYGSSIDDIVQTIAKTKTGNHGGHQDVPVTAVVIQKVTSEPDPS